MTVPGLDTATNVEVDPPLVIITRVSGMSISMLPSGGSLSSHLPAMCHWRLATRGLVRIYFLS